MLDVRAFHACCELLIVRGDAISRTNSIWSFAYGSGHQAAELLNENDAANPKYLQHKGADTESSHYVPLQLLARYSWIHALAHLTALMYLSKCVRVPLYKSGCKWGINNNLG
ncbi:MAG: hypothetical protein JO108_30730 [Acidobacteriaceae bacterium]|nr:hypothetical protein [Acidobacteriaceae bacterium]